MGFTFLAPWMLPAMGLVAVPVVIHLINLLRHRKVEWAAMEFLLESQRKNSAYVLLKQLLLLLLRMLAVAALVAIFAQIMWQTNIKMFGGSETHHLVLLDDSFSMSEQGGAETPFQRAQDAVVQLGRQAANQENMQKFSLLRFSREVPDFSEQSINLEFEGVLEREVRSYQPSQSAVGPSEALAKTLELLGEEQDEARIVYLVTDFRAREWEEPDDLRQALQELKKKDVSVVLIHCGPEDPESNLSVQSLTLASKTVAADVPLFVEAAVTNHGTRDATDVPLMIFEDGAARPGERIERIGPGETKTRRFQVHFPTAGAHDVAVKLERDAVAADNECYLALDFPISVRTLLIDGDPEAQDARFLEAALNPGGSVRTGFAPQIEPPGFLSSKDLEPFRVIYLCNAARLDRSAIENLEAFVKNGGGLGVFLGPRTDPAFITSELHRDGEGVFPVPLIGTADLLVEQLEPVPDLKLSAAHPIFSEFASERNSLLDLVTVERYFTVDPAWKATEKSPAQVIGRLRNNDPLVIESQFGEGRVASFLTPVASDWNDWRKNPSFVFMVLELQAYLAARPGLDQSRLVGTELRSEFPQAVYSPRVR
ncbi:MAG: BatA domain-containing protein, partial [Planctomycetales bacterium]